MHYGLGASRGVPPRCPRSAAPSCARPHRARRSVSHPVNRIVGDGQLVDELHVTFSHSKPMNWFLPNVPPTNKKVGIDIVVIVQFCGDKLACERIYWDHATVLRQVGLLQEQALAESIMRYHQRVCKKVKAMYPFCSNRQRTGWQAREKGAHRHERAKHRRG